MKHLKTPCPSCPWRVDQTAQDIPNFSIEKARKLAVTCPDSRGFGPDFGAPMFACHKSHEQGEFPCAGWLAAVGDAHPNVRLAIMRGDLPAGALRPGKDWPALHGSFQEVLDKLEATK